MNRFKLGLAVAGLSFLTVLVGIGVYFFVASIVAGQPEAMPTAVAVAVQPSPQATMAPTFTPPGVPATAVPDVSPSPTAVAPTPLPTVTPTPAVAPETAVDHSDPLGILIIPKLELAEPVTLVPVRDGAWDISELGSQVGHLQTTGAYPGDDFAMTFTGHVTRPWPEIAGPFADLVFLEHGEEVIYRWQGTDYVYQVERIFRVDPRSVELLYVPDGDTIVLVTCSGWDFVGREYAERLVTRATLVEKRPSPLQPDLSQ